MPCGSPRDPVHAIIAATSAAESTRSASGRPLDRDQNAGNSGVRNPTTGTPQGLEHLEGLRQVEHRLGARRHHAHRCAPQLAEIGGDVESASAAPRARRRCRPWRRPRCPRGAPRTWWRRPWWRRQAPGQRPAEIAPGHLQHALLRGEQLDLGPAEPHHDPAVEHADGGGHHAHLAGDPLGPEGGLDVEGMRHAVADDRRLEGDHRPAARDRRSHLGKVLAESDIGVIPHHATESWNTTIPNKLFDYWAAGLPVITSNAIPASRIVNDCGGGLVFKERNPISLADTIEKLLNSDTRNKCAKEGRKAIVDRYNWEFDFAKLLEAVNFPKIPSDV